MRMFPQNGRQLSLLNLVTMAAKMSLLTQSHSLNVYISAHICVHTNFDLPFGDKAETLNARAQMVTTKVQGSRLHPHTDACKPEILNEVVTLANSKRKSFIETIKKKILIINSMRA